MSNDRAPARNLLLATLAVFVLAMAPYLAMDVFSYPDERHYTVGALAMLETGDYLVPRGTEDEIRLKKPPVAYWMAAAGFAVFGQNPFGNRVMWGVAAVLTLLVVARLAAFLGAGPLGRALAVGVLASNFLFVRAAFRAIPDLPLTLFLTLSALGFVALLFTDRPPPWAAWAAWVGAAFAILTKGLLPVAFLAYTVAFAALVPAVRPRFARLIHPALPVGIVLASSWFLYVAFGLPDAFADFYGDQVTEKVQFNPLTVVTRALSYGLVYVLGMLPWLLAGLAAFRFMEQRTVDAAPGGEKRWAIVYVLGWTAAIAVVFAFGDGSIRRWGLPAYPLLAAVVGVWLERRGIEALAAGARWPVVLQAVLVTLAWLLAAGLVILAGAPVSGAVAVVGMVLTAGLAVHVATRRRSPLALPALAVLPLAGYLAIALASVNLAMPPVSRIAAESLRATGVASARMAIVADPEFVASVGRHGADIVHTTNVTALGDLTPAAYDAILLDDPAAAEAAAAEGFAVETLHGAPRSFDAGALWAAIRAGRLPAWLEEHRSTAFLAARPAG